MLRLVAKVGVYSRLSWPNSTLGGRRDSSFDQPGIVTWQSIGGRVGVLRTGTTLNPSELRLGIYYYPLTIVGLWPNGNEDIGDRK